MADMMDRAIPLVGVAGLEKLHNARVAVIGLGGVGGMALECLVRSGIGHVLIIDHDIVEASNLNRQMLYTTSEIGMKKTEAACKRMLDINPNLEIVAHNVYISLDTMNLLDTFAPTYVIDAIDATGSKMLLAHFCIARNIPFIASLGMGNRLDPASVRVTTLAETSGDPLAKAFRTAMRAAGITLESIPVVFSDERPRVVNSVIASMMAVPATAGILLANHILRAILNKEKQP